MYDLEHTKAYTWKISSINIPTGHSITAASLFFDNIRNWNNEANSLFIHLLDSAKNAGVAWFEDSPSDSTIADNFAGTRYTTNPLVSHSPEPANTHLATFVNLTTSPSDKTVTFASAHLTALSSYISNNANIAFGLDPDCHFFNDGITFAITTANAITTGTMMTPEPASILLFGSIAAGVLYRLRKRRAAEEELAEKTGFSNRS
jgi:hypothetical protein